MLKSGSFLVGRPANPELLNNPIFITWVQLNADWDRVEKFEYEKQFIDLLCLYINPEQATAVRNKKEAAHVVTQASAPEEPRPASSYPEDVLARLKQKMPPHIAGLDSIEDPLEGDDA